MNSRASIPKIFPKPHSLFLHGGFLKFSGTPNEISRGNDDCEFRGIENFPHKISLDPNFAPEEFSISIEAESGIDIRFGNAAKQFAAETFSQIFDQATDEKIPCLTLHDSPDFPERAFMLDVSRGKVPKMSELFALVKLLSKLRYNRLQLYVEHTFAFKNHEEVWRNSSPLLPEEIRELDEFCKKNGIELVPNLNSFGHVERWLKHEKYKNLAECPDGFFHQIFKTQRAAGTFKASEESADFMAELYAEFLPNFSSEIFNIGGDEPWELGQGRSRELCEKFGKKRVYLQQMERLRTRAKKLGKRIMFWADVLLGNENSAGTTNENSRGNDDDFSAAGTLGNDEFLANLHETIPAIWGYEKGHPFAEQCAKVAKKCKNFYVVPGTSAWLSFTGRLDNALANIFEAAAAGFSSGATGLMLTTWGDFGYHNPFCANIFPLLANAALSWNFLGNRSPDLLGAFERFFGSRELAEILFYLGRLDNFFAKKITNRSILREFLFTKKSAFPSLLESVPAKEISAAKNEVRRLFEKLQRLGNDKPRAFGNENFIAAEIALSLEMADLALSRAAAFLKNDSETLEKIEVEIAGTLSKKFAKIWLLRNREGGLDESLSYFEISE